MQRHAIGRNRARHARVAESGHDVPQRLVHRRVRAEREQERHEHAEPEHDREPAFAPREEHEPRDRGERNEPAEEDERLEAVPRVPRDEVEQLGRVALDLRERAARRAGRAADLRDPDEHAGSGARRRTDCADERLPAHDGVGEEEEDRPEREVHLPGQRHGGDRGDREPAAPSLERPEREREQHRDRPEQVSAGGLDRTVRSEREREPADERSAEREPQRTQPGGGRRTRTEVGQERERVPRADGPEERVQRPEDDRERPAGVVRPLRRLGLEAVGVEPRRMPAARAGARGARGCTSSAGGRRASRRPGAACRTRAARPARPRGPARARAPRPRGTARRRGLQRPSGCERHVEVGHLSSLVAPCAADRTALVDEERRSGGDVLQSRGARTRSRARARPRRSSRRAAGSSGRAPATRRCASRASRARRRRAERLLPRTPRSCHAGAPVRSFRWRRSRRGRRRRAPSSPRARRGA